MLCPCGCKTKVWRTHQRLKTHILAAQKAGQDPHTFGRPPRPPTKRRARTSQNGQCDPVNSLTNPSALSRPHPDSSPRELSPRTAPGVPPPGKPVTDLAPIRTVRRLHRRAKLVAEALIDRLPSVIHHGSWHDIQACLNGIRDQFLLTRHSPSHSPAEQSKPDPLEIASSALRDHRFSAARAALESLAKPPPPLPSDLALAAALELRFGPPASMTVIPPETPPDPPTPGEVPLNTGSTPPSAPFASTTLEAVERALSRTAVGDGAGVDGWRVGHLVEAARANPEVAKVLAMLAQRIINSTSLPLWLQFSRLVPLPKNETDIRPISIGQAFWRITARVILTTSRTRITQFLRAHPSITDVGFSEPNGCQQAAVLLDSWHDEASKGSCALIGFDIARAHDSISQAALTTSDPHLFEPHISALLSTLGRYLILPNGTRYVPKCGVNQGCPLAAARFAGSIHLALREVLASFPEVRFLVYADDVYVRIPRASLARDFFSSLVSALSTRGLSLKLTKCFTVGCEVNGVPPLKPGHKALGVFIPVASPGSMDAASLRIDDLCDAIHAGSRACNPSALRACINSSFRPSVHLMASVGNVSTEAAEKFDLATRTALVSFLPDPTVAHHPVSPGMPPLIPACTGDLLSAPLITASTLTAVGSTRSAHRSLAEKKSGGFWGSVVPRCASALDVQVVPGHIVIRGESSSHTQARVALATLTQPPTHTPADVPPGPAALALLGRHGTSAFLKESAWKRFVRCIAGISDPPPSTGACPLCGFECRPEHAALCTHPGVSAARTTRHYALLSFFESLIRSCPSIICKHEPHVHKRARLIGHRRADLRITFLGPHGDSILADIKVIDEFAKQYSSDPRKAADTKQASSLRWYEQHACRSDIRIWVFTIGGSLSQHAISDITRFARALAMPKDTLLALAYATILNAHADVSESYFLARSQSRF